MSVTKKFALCAVTLTIFVADTSPIFSRSHIHSERHYQSEWCSTRGQMEIVMPDGSRADCANATHVVEFDFSRKWAESIGQALNYGAQSGKTPGIVLILEKPEDERYLRRVLKVRETYGLPLEVWAVDRNGNELP